MRLKTIKIWHDGVVQFETSRNEEVRVMPARFLGMPCVAVLLRNCDDDPPTYDVYKLHEDQWYSVTNGHSYLIDVIDKETIDFLELAKTSWLNAIMLGE
jgi:hypothetical protein